MLRLPPIAQRLVDARGDVGQERLIGAHVHPVEANTVESVDDHDFGRYRENQSSVRCHASLALALS